MSMRNRIEKAYFDREYSFKETISRIFDLASTQKFNLIGLVVVTLFEALAYILLPYLVREGLNSIETFQENLSFEFAKCPYNSKVFISSINFLSSSGTPFLKVTL